MPAARIAHLNYHAASFQHARAPRPPPKLPDEVVANLLAENEHGSGAQGLLDRGGLALAIAVMSVSMETEHLTGDAKEAMQLFADGLRQYRTALAAEEMCPPELREIGTWVTQLEALICLAEDAQTKLDAQVLLADGYSCDKPRLFIARAKLALARIENKRAAVQHAVSEATRLPTDLVKLVSGDYLNGGGCDGIANPPPRQFVHAAKPAAQVFDQIV